MLFRSLHGGQTREAIRHLERGVALIEKSAFREYYQDCESLADAYERIDQPDSALRVLEQCAARRPRIEGPNFASPPFWMKLKLRLADTYRLRHRVADAEAIERELRGLLIYADDDHPLVRRLNSMR